MIKMNEIMGYANLALCGCVKCGGEFIVSVERLQHSICGENPRCPYCGYLAEIKDSTTDENRAEIELGFLTLCEPIDSRESHFIRLRNLYTEQSGIIEQNKEYTPR